MKRAGGLCRSVTERYACGSGALLDEIFYQEAGVMVAHGSDGAF